MPFPLRYRHRLRSRIIVSLAVFGTGLSLLFAVSAFYIREFIEDQLIVENMRDELDRYMDEVVRNPATADPYFGPVQGYLVAPGRIGSLPPELRDLDTGVYEISTDQATYQVVVRKEPNIWGFMTYDVTRDQVSERQAITALIAAAIVLSLLSVGLGVWLSARVMAPVTDLAQRIGRFGREEQPDALAPLYADDEVGQLAAALDDYSERLTELVQRDREFNADVSHELRTPLAVIRSATELLMAQPDLPEKTRIRLQRIDRAVRQSTELTDALLQLVRAEKQAPESYAAQAVAPIVHQVIDFNRPIIARKPVKVEVVEKEPLTVRAPAAAISVVINNLISNAFKYTSEGRITVTLEGNAVLVDDTGPGIQSKEIELVFGRHVRGSGAKGKGAGLGLAIVQRLCNLYGWRVEVKPRAERGLRAEVIFDHPAEDSSAAPA